MKLIILDLDETLIHVTEKPLEYEADFTTDLYYVYQRPHLKEFFKFCSEHFQVGIWTTAGEEFAKTVIKNAFPQNYPLQFLWSHKRCTRIYDSENMESY